MLRLDCYITFTTADGKQQIEFFGVNQVEIDSSWKNLTDTCKITLPRRLALKNSQGNNASPNEFFKRGGKVKVWLGYDGDLNLEFVGYVARVSAKVPFVLECEDEMWVYKQNKVSKTYRAVDLKQLIKDIYPGKANVMDFEFGSYRIDRASTSKVLDDLKKHNIYSYFTFESPRGEPILNVGFGGYDFKKIATKHVYNMMVNVVENNLEFRLADENKIKITATSIGKGGVTITATAGDEDGEPVDLDKFNGLAIKDLQKIVDAELGKMKYNGYRGSLTGFGLPYCRHNDIAIIEDPEYDERDGSYIINAVKTTFGMSGFRRVIELGPTMGNSK